MSALDTTEVLRAAEHRGTRAAAVGLYEAAWTRLATLTANLPRPENIRSGRSSGGESTTLPTAAELRELVKVLEAGVGAVKVAADACEVFQAVDAAQRLGGAP